MSEQNTDEWLQDRAGFITASRISDIYAKSAGVSYKKYLYKLAVERLIGEPLQGGFTSERLEQGLAMEPEAKELYMMMNDVDIVDCGFIAHPTIEWFGASPDGKIGDEGLIEIKNRDVHIHLEFLYSKCPPRPAFLQMYAQMSCTGRIWVDYVSYCPSLPPRLRMIKRRVLWDSEEIAILEQSVKKFSKEINELVEKLRNL